MDKCSYVVSCEEGLIEAYQAGAPSQHMPRVSKTANSGANCPPLANFFLSYTLKIEKPGVCKRQSGTARGGQKRLRCCQLPTPG